MGSDLASVYDSLERTLGDFRSPEGIGVSRDRINTWAQQFTDPWIDLPAIGTPGRKDLLAAIAKTLEKTYWSEGRVREFLRLAVTHKSLVGSDPESYWRRTTVLDIQQTGGSQRDMLRLLEEALFDRLGLRLSDCANDAKRCLYVDDGLFTGGTMVRDIQAFIRNGGVNESFELQALFLVRHTNGEEYVRDQLEAPHASGSSRLPRQLDFRSRRIVRNRPSEANSSGVLWPTFGGPDGGGGWRPREPRPGEEPSGDLPEEFDRQLLEKYLFQAGDRICTIMKSKRKHWQPLGFANSPPGFGSMFATYRSCPNNAPLALWWSIQGWEPLLPSPKHGQAG